VRLETAVAAQDPRLTVLAPVRQWPLKTLEEKLQYARRRRLPIEEPHGRPLAIDRNLWGSSLFLDDLVDSWEAPPPDIYQITRAPEQAPDQAIELEIGFESGQPRQLNGRTLELLPLVIQLNQLGGEHGIGRADMIEDRLFGIKSREIYEVPVPTLLLAAHHAVQSLVHSRELIQLKEVLSRRYAELVYSGLWFSDLRQSLQGFIGETQRFVTGQVRLKLYKGNCIVVGRRSPHSLYDSRLAGQSNQELFDSDWAQGFTSLWTLPIRLAARCQQDDKVNR
jgi:argininosuccinate synthase